MNDWVWAMLAGAFIGGWSTYGLYEARYVIPLISKCELNLPRTEKCELTAIPKVEKAK